MPKKNLCQVVLLVLLAACQPVQITSTAAGVVVTPTFNSYPALIETISTVMPVGYPPPTIIPTPTMEQATPAPFSFPTLEALPREDSLTYTPICITGTKFTKCTDEILGLEYEYPNAWGSVTGRFRQGQGEGYAYDYRFNEGVYSGGRSRGFWEGRGSVFMDFPGGSVCGWPNHPPTIICEGLQSNVTLALSFPSALEVCDRESWFPMEPFAIVGVDLPNGKIITGFMFGTRFLGDDWNEKLRSNFKWENSSTPVCDPSGNLAYDTMLDELVQNIRDGTITGPTAGNLDMWRHLGASIRVIAPNP